MTPYNTIYNKIYTPITIGLTLLFLIFFSRGVFAEYVDYAAQISSLEAKSDEKEKALKELSNLQAIFKDTSNTSPIKKKVTRYNKPFNEADVMETVMVKPKQVKVNTDGTYDLIVNSFSVSKGGKLPNGLSLANVSIGVQAKDVDTIIDYITSLTNSNSETAFTIDSISLPIDTSADAKKEEGLSMGLSLGMYYFE